MGNTIDPSEGGPNPFKLQKNFEGILVNRERERYFNKMEKEAYLRGYLNP